MAAKYPLALYGTSIEELQIGDTINGTASAATVATNIDAGAAGQIPYQSGVATTSFIPAGTTGKVLTANGTSIPTWELQSSLAVGTANNLAGGGVGYVPYQSASGTTAFLNAGTAGQALVSNGTGNAPSWGTAGITTGKSIAMAMIFGF